MKFIDWRNKNKIPTIEHLTDKTLKYIDNKDWYKSSNELIKKYYPNDYNLFINILAITSPRNNVKTNLMFTIKTIDNIKYKRNNNIVYGLANGQITDNIKRYIKANRFNGVKINSFADSLKLTDDAVCIDTWMLKAFNLKRAAPTKWDIKYIKRMIKIIADNLGLKTYEIQACLWCYAKKELNGTQFKEYKDFGYYLKAYFEQSKLSNFMGCDK